MRALRVAILAFALLAGSALVAPAADADACVSPTDPALCPPGSVPYPQRSTHNCHGGYGFTCVYLW